MTRIITLKAEVAHISLNPGGGAESLSHAVIRALADLGIEVQLRTYDKPELSETFMPDGSAPESPPRRFRTLNLLGSLFRPDQKSGCDLFFNTHADMLPLYRQGFTKQNSVVYCHYPLVTTLLDSENKEYLDSLFNTSSAQMSHSAKARFVESAKRAYREMIVNSMVLTNSEYSRRAIFKLFGVDSTVVYPPVRTEIFSQAGLSGDARRENILVVSRFHRSKKIENAIYLAKLLLHRIPGSHLFIVGNISPDGLEYYERLKRLVKRCGLEGFVTFEIGVSTSRLLEIMRRSKVYIHPLPGEPFGISAAEAMCAGLIPVAPSIGGHTEFVPKKYQFSNFGEGADAVLAALEAPASEHALVSRKASIFSVDSFSLRFKQVIARILEPTTHNLARPIPRAGIAAEWPGYTEAA